MKYRLPNEYIDLVEVASSQKADVNKHGSADYDVDELLKYVTGLFEPEAHKITDYNQVSVSYYNGPTETYRVVKIEFTDLGSITLFGSRFKTPNDYVVVKKSEYEELTKEPETIEEDENQDV